jgi:hypothetical protein
MAVDVLALAATGIEGSATGFGGGAALQWFAFPALSVRLGGGLRAGTIDSAAASILTVYGCAGLAVHFWRTTPRRPVGASLRSEYVLVDESLTHFGPVSPNPSARSRTLSGVDLVADASLRLGSEVQLLVGGGVEDLFAPTYVDVQGVRVATLPPLRGLAEAGLRLSF